MSLFCRCQGPSLVHAMKIVSRVLQSLRKRVREATCKQSHSSSATSASYLYNSLHPINSRAVRHIMHISESGYDRSRRACAPCSAHLSAGDFTCPARYAIAVATPAADTYHRHAAVRHLSAAMEASAKKVLLNADSRAGGSSGDGGGSGGLVTPLEAVGGVHAGPRAVFEALVPMLSTEVRVSKEKRVGRWEG